MIGCQMQPLDYEPQQPRTPQDRLWPWVMLIVWMLFAFVVMALVAMLL